MSSSPFPLVSTASKILPHSSAALGAVSALAGVLAGVLAGTLVPGSIEGVAEVTGGRWGWGGVDSSVGERSPFDVGDVTLPGGADGGGVWTADASAEASYCFTSELTPLSALLGASLAPASAAGLLAGELSPFATATAVCSDLIRSRTDTELLRTTCAAVCASLALGSLGDSFAGLIQPSAARLGLPSLRGLLGDAGRMSMTTAAVPDGRGSAHASLPSVGAAGAVTAAGATAGGVAGATASAAAGAAAALCFDKTKNFPFFSRVRGAAAALAAAGCLDGERGAT